MPNINPVNTNVAIKILPINNFVSGDNLFIISAKFPIVSVIIFICGVKTVPKLMARLSKLPSIPSILFFSVPFITSNWA